MFLPLLPPLLVLFGCLLISKSLIFFRFLRLPHLFVQQFSNLFGLFFPSKSLLEGSQWFACWRLIFLQIILTETGAGTQRGHRSRCPGRDRFLKSLLVVLLNGFFPSHPRRENRRVDLRLGETLQLLGNLGRESAGRAAQLTARPTAGLTAGPGRPADTADHLVNIFSGDFSRHLTPPRPPCHPSLQSDFLCLLILRARAWLNKPMG